MEKCLGGKDRSRESTGNDHDELGAQSDLDDLVEKQAPSNFLHDDRRKGFTGEDDDLSDMGEEPDNRRAKSREERSEHLELCAVQYQSIWRKSTVIFNSYKQLSEDCTLAARCEVAVEAIAPETALR